MEKFLGKVREQARKEAKENETIYNLIREYTGKTFIEWNDVENVIDDYCEGAWSHYMSTGETSYISFGEWLEAMIEQKQETF